MRFISLTTTVLSCVCIWVTTGAADNESSRVIERSLDSDRGAITDADRSWWAFQPVDDPLVPRLQDDDWSENPIDRFVYRKLCESGLRPAPPASKTILVRRLYFDIIGLPPTPEQIDAFVNDTVEGAWERLVDRLLADPRYGEHWAQHWLDLVRYSESDGWNQDAYRPQIWRYRDYVVRAFNDDKPYPQFVREQLAGDECLSEQSEPNGNDDPEQLAATGFLRLGIYEYNQRDARSHWDAIMNEITDVTGDVFLGMGMACAKCHDHKFDPLLQTDYYRLRAFFEPLTWRDDLHYATAAEKVAYERRQAVWEEATAEVRAKIDVLLRPYHDRKWETTVDKFPIDIQACFRKPVHDRTSWEHQMAYLVERQFEEEGGGPLANMSQEDKEQHAVLLEELAEFDHLKPEPLPRLMAATDFPGPVSPTIVPDDPAETPIEPGCLAVLTGIAPLNETDEGDGPVIGKPIPRRAALAGWIANPDNPLTTRVIVNRVWQHHFGVGLVSTSSDFGRMGDLPTHPELLDWLTRRFVEDGWSVKHLHRLILQSATWRQSSFHPQAHQYEDMDPTESLLWRSRIRRLSAEQIRDAVLAVTGELDPAFGGPSVDATSPRRSLYVKRLRNTPEEFLCAFDTANGLKSVAERNRTTTPTQALLLINGAFAIDRSAKLAERLLHGDFTCTEDMLAYAFRLTWGRTPTEDERNKSLEFLGIQPGVDPAQTSGERLADFCHVLFNSNEFLYVD